MSYPIVLNLAGRTCVVVGAGAVGERRAVGLAASGAAVRVVAPNASERIARMAQDGELVWIQAVYAPAQVEDAFLVIAATDDRGANAAVCRDAHARGILVCCADKADDGSFTLPALVERGALTIAVTTGGASPTLFAHLRAKLAQEYGPEWAAWTQMFSQLRPRIQRISGEARRKQVASMLLEDEEVAKRILAGDVDAAVQEADRCISLLPD